MYRHVIRQGLLALLLGATLLVGRLEGPSLTALVAHASHSQQLADGGCPVCPGPI